jgi:hypothetical protein
VNEGVNIPPGVNEGVNIPRGARGEVKNGPLLLFVNSEICRRWTSLDPERKKVFLAVAEKGKQEARWGQCYNGYVF